MLVQMAGKRVASGADEIASILVLEGRVAGVQQSLGFADWQPNVNPVRGCAVADAFCANAMFGEPVVR